MPRLWIILLGFIAYTICCQIYLRLLSSKFCKVYFKAFVVNINGVINTLNIFAVTQNVVITFKSISVCDIFDHIYMLKQD